jgi:hypothetical protein
MDVARFLKACDCEVSLSVRETLGVRREIGQYEERNDGPPACGSAFHKLSRSVSIAYLLGVACDFTHEKPFPSGETVGSIEVAIKSCQ